MRARARCGELAAFFAEPAQHAVGLGDMFLFTGEIARGLREPRLELRLACLGARLLALEGVALHAQAMQHGRARSFLVAKRLKLLSGFRLLAQRLAFRFGLLRYRAERGLKCSFLLLHMVASCDPMKMMLKRLCGADLAGNLAIALRLARLAPERLQLR